MTRSPAANRFLTGEARGLLARLARVVPFALQESSVPAAAAAPAARAAIDRHLAAGRRELRGRVLAFVRWLRSPAGRAADPADAQRRFTLLRLGFHAVLAQFDLFADVLTQRSESGTGVWLGGLDAAAADALALPGGYYDPPPVVCYLDRGAGAAIRRARTRLPGGGESPVAVIRVPRERMIGSGVASSLVHEVGHQGAALLGLVESLRPAVGRMRDGGPDDPVWGLYERWVSEVVADLWSVARVGVAAPMGLVGVVSLPRAFVFRVNPDGPHPFPWVRVLVSCALGDALYPHPQWAALGRLWESFYPPVGLAPALARLLDRLLAALPAFVRLVLGHRPPALGGASVGEALGSPDRHPARLAALYRDWLADPRRMRGQPPTLVFAALGQARADGRLAPEAEGRLLQDLLTYWAVRAAQAPAGCPAPAARST
jgi:hypothetical protein